MSDKCQSPSIDVRFSVPFVHRLRFTRDILGAGRHVLAELLEPSGPQPARTQFWLDANVAEARPTPARKVRRFTAEFAHRVILTGGPHVVPGGYLLSPQLSGMVVHLARSASVCLAAGAQTVRLDTAEMVVAKVDIAPPRCHGGTRGRR